MRVRQGRREGSAGQTRGQGRAGESAEQDRREDRTAQERGQGRAGEKT